MTSPYEEQSGGVHQFKKKYTGESKEMNDIINAFIEEAARAINASDEFIANLCNIDVDVFENFERSKELLLHFDTG